MALALNSENDIFAEDGQIQRVYESAQVVQNVRSRLLIYSGEWYLDTTAGVQYFEQIFTRPVNLLNVESILKTVIIQTTGISSLLGFAINFDRSSRALSIAFEAETEYDGVIGETVNLTV